MSERGVARSARLWIVVTAGVLAGCNGGAERVRVDPTRAYGDAWTALRQEAEHADPRVRTHALEALADTEGRDAGAVMLQALRDDRLPVVAAAAFALGECRYPPAAPVLLELAKNSKTPPKLRCAVIYALHRLGNYTHTGELGELLRDRDKFVRAEAARVMGKMGEPSAVDLLKSVQGSDVEVVVRLNIAEALALLGDERSMGLLEAFTKSQFVEDRLIAVAALGRMRNRRSIHVLRKVLADADQGPTVQVAAAGSLARLGESGGHELVWQAAEDPEPVLRQTRPEGANIREVEITSLQNLALESLMHMDDMGAVDIIHPLLRSKRGAVRVAAARAILRLLRAYRPVVGPRPVKEDIPAPPAPKTKPVRPPLHSAGGKD